MKNREFDQIFMQIFGTCKTVLCSRAVQYASTTDRLHNFKQAKNLVRFNCQQTAINSMRIKHEVALNDMLYKLEVSNIQPDKFQLEEKIIDNINYLILLYASSVEDGFLESVNNES